MLGHTEEPDPWSSSAGLMGSKQWVFLSILKEAFVAQSSGTLCNPVDCSPPGSSVNGISQARILEWVAISFSRGSFQLRDWTQVSCRFFTTWATREDQSSTRSQTNPQHAWISRHQNPRCQSLSQGLEEVNEGREFILSEEKSYDSW